MGSLQINKTQHELLSSISQEKNQPSIFHLKLTNDLTLIQPWVKKKDKKKNRTKTKAYIAHLKFYSVRHNFIELFFLVNSTLSSLTTSKKKTKK